MLLPARTEAAAVAPSDRATRPLGLEAETWLLVGITVLAAAVRFANITSQSFWLDESQAVHEVHLSFGAMLHAWSSFEWNGPLYLLIAWPWAKVFGAGELGLRSLSAVLGVALVPLIYLCGRELVSRRAGLVAALFTAVSPFMIWYSQEAREYMLLMVLSAASLLFFIRAWKSAGAAGVAWWAAFSALALLTQYFAGFLIAAEAVALLYRARNRTTVLAVAGLAVVGAALIPHLTPRLHHPAEFIVGVPLSQRIEQVPVTFGMSTLYQSPIVSYGLIGAAALAAIVIALLVIGADERELRGAGLAAALAGAVLLVPLVLAALGHDDYLARGLMPAWIPLVIVIAAACTTRRAPLAGGVLAVAVIALFVYSGLRIDTHSQFRKPDWSGVASALGSSSSTRAIVAYDGPFAAGPLSIYMPGIPWAGPGMAPQSGAPVTVSEVDIVGNTAQHLSALPPGTRLLSSRDVNGYRVVRLGLARPWHLPPAAIGERAEQLLGPAPSGPSVLIQPRSA
jgi:mannosyltransferase